MNHSFGISVSFLACNLPQRSMQKEPGFQYKTCPGSWDTWASTRCSLPPAPWRTSRSSGCWGCLGVLLLVAGGQAVKRLAWWSPGLSFWVWCFFFFVSVICLPILVVPFVAICIRGRHMFGAPELLHIGPSTELNVNYVVKTRWALQVGRRVDALLPTRKPPSGAILCNNPT